MRHITPYNILLLAALIACVLAYTNELKRLKLFVVAFGLFVCACLTGCWEATGTVNTPYGSVTYKTPARYDGKTMLPPEPTPAPVKKWWQF